MECIAPKVDYSERAWTCSGVANPCQGDKLNYGKSREGCL